MTEFRRQRVHWDIEYQIHLGEAWGRFMDGLRDRRILANRCPSCKRVFVPPQTYCEACFERTGDWEEVAQDGTVKVFTVVHRGFRGGPPAPYVVGAIQLDGTDTLLMHFIGEVDPNDPRGIRPQLPGGSRVRAVWSDERVGQILDIRHFAPARDGDALGAVSQGRVTRS